jgi:predicted ATPase/class 3 adenylate cyclase
VELPGYQITERISGADGRAQVMRAFRKADGQRVVLKAPPPGSGDDVHERYRTEHALLARVHSPRVIQAFDLVRGPTGPALVLEHADGITLGELLATRALTVVERLRIAVQLAEALVAVQDARVLHLDVNPSNVVVSPSSLATMLIDFGIGSDLEREQPDQVAPGRLRGTLAYIAPEQTGRTSRTVDDRADQYGLGVTLYELFTGRLPFTSPDPLELVHHHVARMPEAPHEVEPSIAPALSRIIVRLIQKNAEDRYRGCAGVVHDLQRCLDEAAAGGRPDFAIGAHDAPSRFRLTEQLFGRSAELAVLLQAFEAPSEGSGTSFGSASLRASLASALFVTGYSGIGKTRLVAEVRRPLAARAGYFVAGKFDQFKRDVPFASLNTALRDLLRQVLTESAAALGEWRARLLEALGGNGALLMAGVPELEAVIGPQPAVVELPPREAQHRFARALRAFVRVFADPAHPLVIFLDDLQWVDSATVAWIESTLGDADAGALLLLGAYRDNEVTPAHPLAEALDRLKTRGARIAEVHVGPLTPADTLAMVADALHEDADRCAELARIVHQKTGGNPFFAGQLLKALHADGAVVYAGARRCWTYDLDQINAAALTDNVVELMVGRLGRLPAETRATLSVAACIGNRFALGTLIAACEKSRGDVLAALQEALREGYIHPIGRWAIGDGLEYRFQHDRVQQAAYAMLSDAEIATLRPKIGWTLLDAMGDDGDGLFDVLHHLNHARTGLPDDRKRRLAALNARAAVRARKSTAYTAALGFADVALELGGETFAAVHERATCAHLAGRPDEAEAGFTRALALASNDAAKAAAYESRVHFYTDRARFPEAYAAGREGAAHFGVAMPASFVPPLLILDFVKVKFALRNTRIGDMVDHKEMTDPRLLTGGRLLAAALKAAYQVRPELCVHNAARLVDLCLKHGNFDDCPVGWLVLGSIFQGGVMGNHAAGYDWGQLSLELVEKFANSKQRAEVQFVYGYFAHSWTKPLRETEEYFRKAWRSAVDSGDNFHASCASSGIVQNLWMRGAPLAEVWAESERFLAFLATTGAEENIGTVHAVRQAIRNLRGETDGPASMASAGFDAAALEATLPKWGSPHFAHFWFVDKLAVQVLRGETAAAAATAEASRSFEKSSTGMQHAADQVFWEGLLAASGTGSLRPLHRAVKQYAAWAKRCPENFAHKHALLQAEAARRGGDALTAAAAYDRAVNGAVHEGFLHHEALALELGGRFHLAIGNQWMARQWLGNAAAAWRSWGADTLAVRIEREHEALALLTTRAVGGRTETSRSVTRTTGNRGLQVDLGAVTKAGLLLAGEVQIGRLLEQLIHVVIENVGAERGVLLLAREGRWIVEAEGRVGEPAQVLQGTPLESHGALALSVINLVARTRQTASFADASSESLLASDPYVVARRPRSLLCMPVVHAGVLKGLLYLENNLVDGAFTPERSGMLELLSGQIAVSLENAILVRRLEDKVRDRTRQLEQHNDLLRQTFGRYLSNDVVESLLASPEGISIGGERRTVTVLMSDLRGFSAISESVEPERVVALLNNYLSIMTDVITAHKGTIDEFIGDAILVIFGAPFARPDDAERAVACALAMQRAMHQVSAYNVAHGLPEVEMGIGINTGEVVLGNIGSERRAKYAVVGPTVNLASRIESYTVGGQVLVSEATASAVTAPLRVGGRLKVEPKGVKEPMTIIDVVGIGAPWAVDLEDAASELHIPEPGLRIRYRVLSGKDVLDEPMDADVLGLSLRGARVRSGRIESPLTNLRLRLLDAAGEVDADVYAKVVARDDGDADTFALRFTHVPPAARDALRGHLGAS